MATDGTGSSRSVGSWIDNGRPAKAVFAEHAIKNFSDVMRLLGQDVTTDKTSVNYALFLSIGIALEQMGILK
jgi:hypothetical protein